MSRFLMRTAVLSIIVSSLLLAQAVEPPSPATRGAVEGTVLSADGSPVPNIMVYAVPERGNRSGLKFPARTDGSGYFRLDNVKAGPSVIFAYSDEEGYLDPSSAFNSGNKPSAIATVVPGGLTKVQVRLGPKCAYLVGAVQNSEDGAPLATARFMLSRADDPKIWLSTGAEADGHFRIGVPSDAAFKLEVTVQGFRRWQPGTDRGTLTLKPSQEYSLSVRLQPASPSAH